MWKIHCVTKYIVQIIHCITRCVTKLHNFTKFRMLFPAVLMNFPNSKVCLIGEWSIDRGGKRTHDLWLASSILYQLQGQIGSRVQYFAKKKPS